jgi:hypothetical protein
MVRNFSLGQQRPFRALTVTREIVICDLATLQAVATRGLLPSLPGHTCVHLAILAETHPRRAAWEKELGRHAQACGCEAAAGAFALTGGVLAALHALGTSVTLAGLPLLAAWCVLALAAALVAKLAYLEASRRTLLRLRDEITAAVDSRELPTCALAQLSTQS